MLEHIWQALGGGYVAFGTLTAWNLAAVYGAYCFIFSQVQAWRRRKVRKEVLHRAIDRYV